MRIARCILASAALLCATGASAHSGTGLAGGFGSGFAHPLSGPDHMLAMVSVGLWGAFLGRPLVYVLPVIFPIMMSVGGAIGMAGIDVPPVELGIAASVIVLGAMILGAVRAPAVVACAVVAVFALFHGYAHGAELPSAADPVGYTSGFVLATGLLHVIGIGFGSIGRFSAGMLALRAAGGAIVLAGFWFLAQAL